MIGDKTLVLAGPFEALSGHSEGCGRETAVSTLQDRVRLLDRDTLGHFIHPRRCPVARNRRDAGADVCWEDTISTKCHWEKDVSQVDCFDCRTVEMSTCEKALFAVVFASF